MSITLSIWIVIICLAVSKDDAFGYLIPAVGVLASFYAVMFLMQYSILKWENGYKIALIMKLVGPLFSVFMNRFKYGQWDNTLYGFIMNIHYFSIIFAQGMMDQFYID